MKDHEKLLGKSVKDLKALAPDASHQHKKGGLYLDLGIAIDTETGLDSITSNGHAQRAWLHVYPYKRQVFLRGVDEDHKFTSIT